MEQSTNMTTGLSRNIQSLPTLVMALPIAFQVVSYPCSKAVEVERLASVALLELSLAKINSLSVIVWQRMTKAGLKSRLTLRPSHYFRVQSLYFQYLRRPSIDSLGSIIWRGHAAPLWWRKVTNLSNLCICLCNNRFYENR